ncbi:MAG: SpoIID/LytB domain-containing protein [Candidatus Riflebacteria bacterium]|nr:SpoIID/LytB domain-containing protein [Candidatus Riflebacteria bacterium]
MERLRLSWRSVCLILAVLILLGPVASIAEAAEKQIKIKIAQYVKELEFNCSQGGTWELGGQNGKILPGDKCFLAGVMTGKARKLFHVMVSSTALADSELLRAEEKKWQQLGYPVKTMVIGRIHYAEDNKTLLYDNRKAMVEVGVFNDQASAQAMVDKLAAGGQSSWIYEEVVQLAQGNLTLSVNGSFKASGREFALLPQQTVHMKKVEYGAGYAWHGYADRDYTGSVLIRYGAQDAIDCILTTAFENVLAGVVPSEISAKAEIGALQAQAVAARGEIMAKIGTRHVGEGFDTCSEQHCQVFSGNTVYSVEVGKKIAPTAGYVLTDARNNILDAVYSANCGGHSEASHLVWTTQPNPILCGKWDSGAPPALDLSEEEQVSVFIRNPPACYCNNPNVEGGNRFRWKKTLAAADIKKVEATLGIGRIKAVKDIARGVSGRIYRLTFVGERGEKTVMKELNIRRLFGGLASACFIASWNKDAAGFISSAELIGAGFGHGVGMCQTGAQSLAKQGWSFQRILAHYFPGSQLKKLY